MGGTDPFDDFSSPESPYFEWDQKKSCIGKRILVYKLKFTVEPDFFDLFSQVGELSFPLGEKYPLYQYLCIGKCVVTGMFGNTEIKVVPRVKASLLEVQQWFEWHLNQYGIERSSS